MKKIMSIALLAAVCLSLSACGKKDEIKVGEVSTPEEQMEVQKDLMKWMESGEAIQCSIAMDGDEIIMKAKDKNVRIEGIPYMFGESAQEEGIENANGVSLTVGDWTYMWNKVSKEGMKFNNKEMEELGKETGSEEEQDYDNWEDQVENWENDGVEYDCEKTKLDDDLFVEPKDVKFTDMGEMMKGFAEVGENMEKQIEAGEMPDFETLKDLLPEGIEMPEIPIEQ